VGFFAAALGGLQLWLFGTTSSMSPFSTARAAMSSGGWGKGRRRGRPLQGIYRRRYIRELLDADVEAIEGGDDSKICINLANPDVSAIRNRLLCFAL
jgi:hypothetical protein